MDASQYKDYDNELFQIVSGRQKIAQKELDLAKKRMKEVKYEPVQNTSDCDGDQNF